MENIHIYQTASVSYGLNGEKMTDFDALADAGACGFTDDGIPLLNATFCYEAMQKAAALHMPISLHEEDKAFITITVLTPVKLLPNSVLSVHLPLQKK